MTVLMWVGLAVAALLATAAFIESLAARRALKRLPAPGIRVSLGARSLHLFRTGEGPGPTVVIEQGAGSPSCVWWPLQQQLARLAPVVSYDRAGYLWSDDARGKRSLDDRVQDLHDLLQAAAIPGPYILVAHSYGGLLALRFARKWPQLMAGLVMVDAPAESTTFSSTFLAYCAQGAKFQRVAAIMARFGILRMLSRRLPMPLPDDPAQRALCVSARFMAITADDFGSLVRAGAAAVVERAREFGTLRLVALTHGLPFPGPSAAIEADWQQGMQRLVTLSEQGSLVVAQRSNHLIHVDEPELVVDAVRSILQASPM